MANKEISPFDFVNSASYTKIDMSDDIEAYVPYLTNIAFSYFSDTIFHANLINCMNELSKQMQYDYYLNTLSKKRRFSKWKKRIENDDLEAVSKWYGYNREKAKAAVSLLSRNQLDDIKIRLIRSE